MKKSHKKIKQMLKYIIIRTNRDDIIEIINRIFLTDLENYTKNGIFIIQKFGNNHDIPYFCIHNHEGGTNMCLHTLATAAIKIPYCSLSILIKSAFNITYCINT